MAASAAGIGPMPKVSRGIDVEASSSPKRRAREGSIRPEGNGRRLVRGMRTSLSRSRNMFSTLAAATTSAVPASVSRASEAGTRTGASQRPVAAVKTTDAVIRGLVSSRYALPAEMASRGRIGVPRWEVQLARTMKGAVGGEAEHRRGLRPLRPGGEREQSLVAVAKPAHPHLTPGREDAHDDGEGLPPNGTCRAQIEDDRGRARKLRDGACEQACRELVEGAFDGDGRARAADAGPHPQPRGRQRRGPCAAGLAAQAPAETFDEDDGHESDHRLDRQIDRPPHG